MSATMFLVADKVRRSRQRVEIFSEEKILPDLDGLDGATFIILYKEKAYKMGFFP